jgi:hypothetical protein
MKARSCTGAVLLTAAVAAAPAAAAGMPIPVPAGSRVQLLESNTVAPRARRCLTRLREELTAGGFQVTVSEFGAGGDALWMVDPPSPRDGSLATIALIGNPDDGPAELWIVDGAAGGRAVVRRLVVPAGTSTHDDEVLAIRTLEFLRASALELARAPTTTATATPTPAPTAPHAMPAAVITPEHAPAPASPLAPPGARGPFSFELGLSLLAASLSLEPAYLPVARLRAEMASLLEARITVAGLGTRPQLVRSTGTATVGQTLGLVEMRVAFRRGQTLRPAVGVGGGVLLVQVDGAGNGSYEGRGGRAWAGLLDISAGLTIALGRRLAIAIDAHGQVAAPYPSVRFSGQEAARIDRPALLTSLTLVTAL